MIPDFPDNIRDSQQGRELAKSGSNKKKIILPILFLYYEESLVSSNLNSKLLRFHNVRPNVHTREFLHEMSNSNL